MFTPDITEKQELLETASVARRLEKVYGLMQGEMSVLQVEKKIKSRVKSQMERTQREYYLNEQMKAIQKELGEMEDAPNELADLEQKIEEAGMPKEAKEKAVSELNKLKLMSPMSAEATVVRNYVDWLVKAPWKKRSKVFKDLKKAEDVLEADHYGLEKVKERILEYLAVQQRVKTLKGPILCLVGPPGVGKTSLGQSIARSTNRKFVRMSLGGVRDEAEIRGHRRTYIGSMPGKIIQNLAKTGVRNPLFLLDEIDKMAMDFRGDPASALLEVLDPEQNHTFQDHYLEVDVDLSEIMFVATANTMNIPPALLDRMEVIRLAGYTELEKVKIVQKFILPKQLENHGLGKGAVKLRGWKLALCLVTAGLSVATNMAVGFLAGLALGLGHGRKRSRRAAWRHIRKLRDQSGLITLDPGYGNTGSCQSAIAYIDGERGILRYRGIPIEQFEQQPNFVEVAWLLIFGKLPSAHEYTRFSAQLTGNANIDESMKHHFQGFPRTAPPMGALFAVNMLVATDGGNTYTLSEIRDDLTSAGFTDVKLIRRDEGMHSVVSARRAS